MFNNSTTKKMNQITKHIMMIKPVSFRYNEQTAESNFYQKSINNLTPEQVQENALNEFNVFVKKLENLRVNVFVIEDIESTDTPDSIFPNNWISTHSDGSIFMYPMFARNRRTERRSDIIEYLQNNFAVKNVFNNTSFYENNNLFLEGTGSMVLDRENKIAYASISQRTNKKLLEKWCRKMNYYPISFSSNQIIGDKKEPIYHTNVMMCVAEKYAVICLNTIDNEIEREMIVNSFKESGKEIIEISEEQTYRFAGNMLQVMGDRPYLIMSTSAYESLTETQIDALEKYNPIIYSSLDTIEACGGGSVRCMMAEIFLPLKK